MYAYIARYGHQPLSELQRMSMRDLIDWTEALGAIVRRENGD